MPASNDLLVTTLERLITFEQEGYRFASFEIRLHDNSIQLRIEGVLGREDGEERICRREAWFVREHKDILYHHLLRLLGAGLPPASESISEEEASTS